jgi:hypothetical protein
VAAATAIEVEDRSEPAGKRDPIHVVEPHRRGGEEGELRCAQACKRAAGAGCSASRTWVSGSTGAAATGAAATVAAATGAAATGAAATVAATISETTTTTTVKLCKSRSRQGRRPQHRSGHDRNGPPPCIVCHFQPPSHSVDCFHQQ